MRRVLDSVGLAMGTNLRFSPDNPAKFGQSSAIYFTSILERGIFASIMAKELLLYTGINNYTVAGAIEAINAYKGKPLTIRINSYGGDGVAAWGLYDKVRDHGDITCQVDGAAMSAAGNLLLFCKKVVALSASSILFHRAASTGESDVEKKWLADTNANMKKTMVARINPIEFQKVTGFTIDEMFSMDDRKDILLTAQQAKQIGLVDEIKELTPDIHSEIEQYQNDFNYKIAAEGNPTPTPTTMTVDELKLKFPATYSAIFEAGKTEGKTLGVKDELDRVKAWSEFVAIDAEAVKKGIDSGLPVTMSVISAMTVKGMNKKTLGDAEADGAGDVTTAAPDVALAKTAKQREVADYESKIDAELERTGLKKKEAKK